jgi:hypothetical protein
MLPHETNVPVGPSYCHLCDSKNFGYRNATTTIFFYATGIDFEPPSTFEATEALKVVQNYISFNDKLNGDSVKIRLFS